MIPRWEQVDEFLWRTHFRHGWLYKDVRDSEPYYEPDPETGRADSKWPLGGQRMPDIDILVAEVDILASVYIVDSLTCNVGMN